MRCVELTDKLICVGTMTEDHRGNCSIRPFDRRANQWAIKRRATAITPRTKAESMTISVKPNELECLSLTGASVVWIQPPLPGRTLKSARFMPRKGAFFTPK